MGGWSFRGWGKPNLELMFLTGMAVFQANADQNYWLAAVILIGALVLKVVDALIESQP